MDDAAFDAFYAASATRVLAQVAAMTGDWESAQDVVQEAFVRAWLARRSLRPDENPEAWVRTTAWRLAVSRWRRAGATARALGRRGLPEPVPPPGDDTVALVAALRRLPAEQRRVLVLHHLVDLPVEQVAREVGAPVGTVKSRLARGRAGLAALLGEQIPDPVTPELHHG